MDITDFSKGIITDFDEQDSINVQGSVRDLVNFDIRPGELRRRFGTKSFAFDLYDNNYALSADSSGNGTDPIGLVPSADEEIIQIEEVYAPDAKLGSVKGYTGLEQCFNEHVTVVMTKTVSVTPVFGRYNRYRLYADIYTSNKFVAIPLSYSNSAYSYEFFCAGDDTDIPFIIPRQSAVAIGNCLTYSITGALTENKGVLWCGHIKKMIGWSKDLSSGAYKYLFQLDEWRLCNAECYDAQGLIKNRIGIGNNKPIYETISPFRRWLESSAKSLGVNLTTMQDILSKRFLGKMTLVENDKKYAQYSFNVKTTLEYDGFQETRPLTGREIFYIKNNVTAGYTAIDSSMPSFWSIKDDTKHNQFTRVEVGDREPHVYLDMSFFSTLTPSMGNMGTAAENPFKINVKLRWNNKFVEQKPIPEVGFGPCAKNGDLRGFALEVRFGESYGNYNDYMYPTKEGIRIAFQNRCWIPWMYDGPSALSASTANMLKVGIYFILGGQPKDYELNFNNVNELFTQYGIDVSNNFIHAQLDWIKKGYKNWEASSHNVLDQVRSMFQIVDVSYELTAFGIAGHFNIADAPYSFIQLFHTVPQPGNTSYDAVVSQEFALDDYSGSGIMLTSPQIPSYFFKSATVAERYDPRLLVGGRRISGIKNYIKRDLVDIDYGLVNLIKFNHRDDDTEQYGIGDEDLTKVVNFREAAIAQMADANAWRCPMFALNTINGEEYLGPWHSYIGVSGYNFPQIGGFGNKLGIEVFGGINEKFMITDEVLTSTAATSLLSANLLRDEWKTDAPVWKRGDMFEGRLFGISMKSGDLQYSVVGGGVPQYDIMPGDFNVSKNEIVTHLVSWRGQHHLIFTNENLWRIDLADGDQFHWRVMDTFGKRGTELWRAIVNTPEGVFYPNGNGIWVYTGNTPTSIVDKKWSKDYVANWRDNTSPSTTYGGYDSSNNNVYFSISTSSKLVWLFDANDGAWRKYQYVDGSNPNDSILPHYMKYYRNRFLLSFDKMDLRTVDYKFLQDGRNNWKVDHYENVYNPFMVMGRLPELQGLSEVDLPYSQYLGVRYKNLRDENVYDDGSAFPRLGICHLVSAYDDKTHLEYILCSNSRHERFYPIMLGIGRGLGIVFGVGAFTSDPIAGGNHGGPTIISGFSVRGQDQSQWSGTYGN